MSHGTPAGTTDPKGRGPGPAGNRRGGRASGFTLVELLVVMGIIVMAAGLMAPAITNFFRNRTLDAVRGQFGSVFSRARLKAVTEGRDISVVFFREGVRIFDDYYRIFADEGWSPSDSDLAADDVWYVLGSTADRLASTDQSFQPGSPKWQPRALYVAPFAKWHQYQQDLREQRRSRGAVVDERQYDVTGLPRITFRRDGTLLFGPGLSDVRSADYEQEPPRMADIEIYQLGNSSACFIDVRPTGRTRSKFSKLSKAAYPPTQPALSAEKPE